MSEQYPYKCPGKPDDTIISSPIFIQNLYGQEKII